MTLRGEVQSLEAQLAALNALQQSSDLDKVTQEFIEKQSA